MWFPKISVPIAGLKKLVSLGPVVLGKIEAVCEVAFIYIKHRAEIKSRIKDAWREAQNAFFSAFALFAAPLRLCANICSIVGDFFAKATETEADEKYMYGIRDKLNGWADGFQGKATAALDDDRLHDLDKMVRPK